MCQVFPYRPLRARDVDHLRTWHIRHRPSPTGVQRAFSRIIATNSQAVKTPDGLHPLVSEASPLQRLAEALQRPWSLAGLVRPIAPRDEQVVRAGPFAADAVASIIDPRA